MNGVWRDGTLVPPPMQVEVPLMKKRIIILSGVVVAVIVLWSAAWLGAAFLIRQNVDALALADGVTAPTVTCETLRIGGYPFRFDATCIKGRIVSGDIVVDVPVVRASVRIFAPTHMLGSLDGPLTVVDNFTGSRNEVTWSELEVSVRLANWRIARASVSGKDMVWSDALFGVTVAQSPMVELHLLDIPEQYDAERGLAALAVYGVTQAAAWPGLTLTDAGAEIQLEVSGLPDDVRNWGDPMVLRNFAQAGGALKIVSIRGNDAASTVDAQGEIRLDPQGLPEGQVTISSTGVAQRIGPLLEEPWRTLVLGTPAPDGLLTNQINFRGGAILSGLVPIAGVAPLF